MRTKLTKMALLGATVSILGSSGIAQDTKDLTFGYMQLTTAFSYALQQEQGFRDVLEGHGAKVITTDGKYSVEKQANDVQDLLIQKVAGVGILPTDGAAAVNWVDNFTDAGIPVVAGASAIGYPDDVLATNGDYVYPGLVAGANSNDYESGVGMGAYVASRLPKDRTGKIAIVEGAPGSISNRQRTDGFIAGLDASGVAYDLVANQPTDWTPENAQAVCQNVLTANPDLDFFYIHADTLATGCAYAVQQSGSSALIVSAAGGARDGNDLIEADQLHASICTKPYSQGRAMAEALYAAVVNKDETKGAFLTYPVLVVTKDNLAECEPEW